MYSKNALKPSYAMRKANRLERRFSEGEHNYKPSDRATKIAHCAHDTEARESYSLGEYRFEQCSACGLSKMTGLV
jgi:hypothetical protein